MTEKICKSGAIKVAVINFKGGVEKSFSALSNAQSFAIKGYRTLLIDGDSQGTATAFSGQNPDQDISRDETLMKEGTFRYYEKLGVTAISILSYIHYPLDKNDKTKSFY